MSNLPNFPILRPSLLLDFANSKQVDPRITFTRASTATYYDAQGVLRTAASGVPRIDHDPVTGECKGLLIEEARTNLLLNSVLAGTNLATQSVTVTAVAHTLSFYGTGTATLSGTHAAAVVGTGAYPARTTLTFTPTAGTLTLTVTGTVQFANLEVGASGTSFIPTAGAAATRAADAASMTGTNFSEWYRQDEGTFVADAQVATINNYSGTFRHVLQSSQASSSESRVSLLVNSVNQLQSQVAVSSVVGSSLVQGANTGSVFKVAIAYKTNDFAFSANGSAPTTNTSGSVPSDLSQMFIGGVYDGNPGGQLNGHIRRIAYYPVKLSSSQLQALTS